MSTPKPAWEGLVMVVSSPRNRTRMRDRLSEMARESDGLDLSFAVPRGGVVRTGGMRGASVVMEFGARNDDPNRIPTDVARKIRNAMGDAEVACHVVVFEVFA